MPSQNQGACPAAGRVHMAPARRGTPPVSRTVERNQCAQGRTLQAPARSLSTMSGWLATVPAQPTAHTSSLSSCKSCDHTATMARRQHCRLPHGGGPDMTVITAQGVVGAAVDKHTARTALAAEVTWHGWNTRALSADSTECSPVALGWEPVKNPVNIAVRQLQSCDAVTGCCIVFI